VEFPDTLKADGFFPEKLTSFKADSGPVFYNTFLPDKARSFNIGFKYKRRIPLSIKNIGKPVWFIYLPIANETQSVGTFGLSDK